MLNIRVEIGRIDYRRCVEALLPSLVEHCAAKERPTEPEKLLAELGRDAVPAVCGMLEELDTDAKDTLVVWLATAHEEWLRAAANRELTEKLGGPLVQIGRLLARDRPGTRMTLVAAQVAVDCPALLSSPLVADGVERIGDGGILKGAAKLAIQMGAFLPPESLEKQGVALLNSKKVKERLLSALTGALRQAGLEIEVEDLVAEAGGTASLPETAAQGAALVPEDFEDALLDALAARLREKNGESRK